LVSKFEQRHSRLITWVVGDEVGGAGEDAGMLVLVVALEEAVDGVGAVRTDGVRGEAAAVLLDGLAVRAGAARVVQRLLQHDVRLVRAANAPRAVFVVPTSSQSFRERLPKKPRNGMSCSARAQERAYLTGRRAPRPRSPAGRGELDCRGSRSPAGRGDLRTPWSTPLG
jgi:hypothetical protein